MVLEEGRAHACVRICAAIATAGAARNNYFEAQMRLVPQVYRGSRTRRFVLLPACALALTIAVMMFLAYFPFDWNPPHTIDNDVTRTAQGDLRFGEHNAARSSRPPEWLIAAQSAERLTIDVEARPQFPQRNTPASIMMLARDFWHTSFAIGQDETSLVLWVRRTGSTDNGDPPFTVPDAFRPNHWTRVKSESLVRAS